VACVSKMVCFAPISRRHHLGKWLYFIITTCFAINAAEKFLLSTEKTINFRSDDGSIAVYDEAMPEWLTNSTEQLFAEGSRWLYQHPDKLANVVQRGEEKLDWSAPLSPDFFMKTRLWIVMKKLMVDFTGLDDYMAYQVQGMMLRRGDLPKVVKGEMASHDIVCRIFLSSGNTSNSEMMFYNHKGEVMQPVQKKFGRVVLWNATLDYSMKQPGFQTFKTEYSLLIKLSRDRKKLQQELEYIKKVRDHENHQKMANFPTYNEKGNQYTNEFFEKHLTRKFYSRNGGVISYFDGILNETELTTLRSYLITHNTAYSNTGFTTAEDDDSDNVSWIAMFLPESINNTRMLDLVKGMARYLSGEDDWYPYDVSLNMIQSTFHTRIHEDCEKYEHEYTFLLYLNPNWTADMYGETIFLDQIQDIEYDKKGQVIQEKAYETIVSVKPKYGRMAMFRNIIPHSARPPSPDFRGTRYTFAVKLSRTRHIGLTKILRELLEMEENPLSEGGQLYKNVSDSAKQSQFPIPEETLLENIKKYRDKKNELSKEDNEGQITRILRKKYVGMNQPSV